MNPIIEHARSSNRRQFFGRTAGGIGIAALATLLQEDGLAAQTEKGLMPPLPGLPHLKAKAKRIVVLWQGGGPSSIDLFDYKPNLIPMRLEQLPESVRQGTRLSTMTASQNSYPILPALKPFKQYGQQW